MKKKVSLILITSLIINGILGYTVFWQWRSRTVQFMNNYDRLYANVRVTQIELGQYLNEYRSNGDIRHYERAIAYLEQASSNRVLFSNFYYNNHGAELTDVLYHVLDPNLLRGQEDNWEFLTRYHVYLVELGDALQKGGGKKYTTIPKHSINKEVTAGILDVAKKINVELSN